MHKLSKFTRKEKKKMLQKLAQFFAGWDSVGNYKNLHPPADHQSRKHISRFLEQKVRALLSAACLDDEVALLKLVHWGTWNL